MFSSTAHAEISKPHLLAMYVSSFSMFALAAALVYFSVELVGVAKQIPDILKLVEHASDKIDPVVDEVAEIKEMIPSILLEVEEIRKLAKPAIDEYAKTNAQIPRILDEIEATRKTLPEITATVDDVLKEVAATRKTIPAVLKTVNEASDTGLVIAKEVEGVRGLVPDVLAEVKATRESIPGMMTDADKLIDKARVAGKEASRGAVTGIFSGIIMAPFDFVGDVGKSLIGVSDGEEDKFTAKDYELIKTTAQQLLHHGELDEKIAWQNEDSGSSGAVELLAITEDFEDDGECRLLSFYAENADGELEKREVDLCQDEDGEWSLE